MRCAVFGCNSDNQTKTCDKHIMFFRFPMKTASICKMWINACKRKDSFNVNTARMCELHFDVKKDFERNLREELLGYNNKNRRLLRVESIPTLNLFKKKISLNEERTNRASKRNKANLVNKRLMELDNHCVDGPGANTAHVEDLTDNDSQKLLETSGASKNIGINIQDIVHNEAKIIEELKMKNALLETHSNALQSLFSPAQIKNMTTGPNTRAKWTIDDVSNAIVIHSYGPRAYRLLLTKGYPFPTVSTLRSWCKKIEIVPGILKQVVNIIKNTDMTEMQKVCVLSFDEMKVRKVYLYDKLHDETLKPYNYVQVVMLRGLLANWKQPIFFDYDCKLSKCKLLEIIEFVEASGFLVVAVVSDIGGGNKGLHSELQISIDKTWFVNPANNHKIYVFADVPHLVKLIRNNFLDYGFIINGKEIDKSIIEKLSESTKSSDLEENIYVTGAHRQKVELATKLFSHTVSRAITRCGTLGHFENKNWLECAQFFKEVNDWFDTFNVKIPEQDMREKNKGSGLELEAAQSSVLKQMTKTMSNLRVKSKKTLLPFQKGILINNNSLPLLYDDLKSRFGIKYLLTYRLNQDVLENLFDVIRAKAGLHDAPNPLEFKYRLRSHILGRNEGSILKGGNVEEDTTPDLTHVSIHGTTLSESCFIELFDEKPDVVPFECEKELTNLESDGLEYLAGYICRRLRQTAQSEPQPGTSSSSESHHPFVSHLSEGEGELVKPSLEMMKIMERLDQIFNIVNSESLLITKNYSQKLKDYAVDVPCSDKVKSLFFRSRLYFRMRNLNKDLLDRTLSRKRKMSKTIL